MVFEGSTPLGKVKFKNLRFDSSDDKGDLYSKEVSSLKGLKAKLTSGIQQGTGCITEKDDGVCLWFW